jgi:hypothetical protein
MGATFLRADPGQKQDPAKVTIYAPMSSMFLRLGAGAPPLSGKGIQAALHARSDPPLTELAPLLPRGRGASLPSP